MSRPAPLQRGDRPGAILAAALECFNASGIEGAAIGDIARRSGASIGSIYHHFGSKEGLAVALLAEGFHDHARLLERRLARARSARAALAALVGCLVDWIALHPEWARFIYTVSSTRLGQVDDAQLRAVNAGYQRLVERHFAAYQAAGAFRSLPRPLFAALVLGPVHDYARRWLLGQVPDDIRDHTARFVDAAWSAVRNPRRR